LATTQVTERNLDCALRETGGVSDRTKTRGDWFPFMPRRPAVEVQINQISRGLLVVSDQVAHEHVENVIVNGNGLFEARQVEAVDS
jgi:hypothetical protein